MHAKKPRLHTGQSTLHRLQQALSCGVVELLSGIDVMRLLSTAHALRFDQGVVRCALRCATTTTAAVPLRWHCVDMKLMAQLDPLLYPTALRFAWRMDALLTNSERTCDVETRLLPQPFLQLTSSDQADTNEVDVAAMLQEIFSGVTLATPESVSASSIGVHWDQLCVSADGHRVDCEICETAIAAVCNYREETERFANELEEKMTIQEEQWESEGRTASEIVELSYDFQRSALLNEPRYDVYVANQSDDNVLSFIVTSQRFPLELPRKCDLRDVLSAQTRAACRAVYQPLYSLMCDMCSTQPKSVLVGATQTHGDVVAGVVPWRYATRDDSGNEGTKPVFLVIGFFSSV